MKITKKYNKLSFSGFKDVLKNRKRYTNFNPYGFCMGLWESKKLTDDQKIEVRELFIKELPKQFEWFKIKNSELYAYLYCLGLGLERLQIGAFEDAIDREAKRILKSKGKKRGGYGVSCDCGHCRENGHTKRKKYKNPNSAQGQKLTRDKKQTKRNWVYDLRMDNDEIDYPL